MDGENHGKPYEQMDDLGVPLFSETSSWTPMNLQGPKVRVLSQHLPISPPVLHLSDLPALSQMWNSKPPWKWQETN